MNFVVCGATWRLIRQRKSNLEEHIPKSSKSNLKEFHSYGRNKKVLGSTIGPLATTHGNIVNEDTEMANILNYFFLPQYLSMKT